MIIPTRGARKIKLAVLITGSALMAAKYRHEQCLRRQIHQLMYEKMKKEYQTTR